MEETKSDLAQRISGLSPFTIQGIIHWVDILLVAYVFFRIFKLIRGRQAWKVVIGAIVFLLALFVSDRLGLQSLHYVLEKATLLAPVALTILLLPELRQAIEGFARLGFWSERLLAGQASAPRMAIDEIVTAVGNLADVRTGALVVIERSASLDDIVATGTHLNAALSSVLLESIFYGENPLHDGAVVVRGSNIVAAACRLPLSESTSLSGRMHMRHRAGVGVTEHADCISIIVSEERGRVSIAQDGKLTEMYNLGEVREFLAIALGETTAPIESRNRPGRKKK